MVFTRRAARCGGLALAVGLTVTLAGCGGSGEGSGPRAAVPDATHVMADGTRMSDAEMSDAQMAQMPGMGSEAGSAPGADAAAESGEPTAAPGHVRHFTSGPSAAAAMICSEETARAVRRNLALPGLPPASDHWAAPTYTCAYTLPHGTLRLSVRDLRPGPSATAWFQEVQHATTHARPLRGLEALGLPAFQAPGGQVGFLKDGRTLVVDASRVGDGGLPPGFSRTGVAYGVAAAVIACWSE